jgi:hypothetical protein
VNTVFVLLLAPNDGGGQWGPRYLLFSYLPLVPLIADGFERLAARRQTIVFAAFILLCGLWIQRDAYRTLRGTKLIYGQILTAVRDEVPPTGLALTDLWWLDQVTAAANDRTILYEPPASAPDVVRKLDALAIPSLAVVRSRTESPDVRAWNEDTCYVEGRRREIEPRTLVIVQLVRECGE